MPSKVRKDGSKWRVVNTRTGKTETVSRTKRGAQQAAAYRNRKRKK